MLWTISQSAKKTHNPLEALRLGGALEPWDESWDDGKPPSFWYNINQKVLLQNWINQVYLKYLNVYLKLSDEDLRYVKIEKYLEAWEKRQEILPGGVELRIMLRSFDDGSYRDITLKAIQSIEASITSQDPSTIVLGPLLSIISDMEDLDRRFQSTPTNSTLWEEFGTELNNHLLQTLVQNYPKAAGGRPTKEEKERKQAQLKEDFEDSVFVKFEDSDLGFLSEDDDDE